MTRAAAIAFSVLPATPAFAAGGFEDMPWWEFSALFAVIMAPFALLAAGVGFFLQGFFRLRNALMLVTLSASFLVFLVAIFSFEKALAGLALLAGVSVSVSPFFALGWFMGIKDATRRSNRLIARTSGINHG